MQEEVTQRTVALCVEATKLSAGMLQQAMKKVLDEMQKGVTGHKTKLHHGKQTLRQLMKHNTGVSNIEITDQNIRAFSATAKKYGIDFALKKDTSGEMPRYLVFFKGRDADVTQILSICIFLVIYGRMIEVYLVTSIGPIPFATMVNREWGSTGQNYLRSLLALGFQAFLIMICVGIYAVLVEGISTSGDNISAAIWGCMGYTVLLCYTLFKTGSLAKSLFGAH